VRFSWTLLLVLGLAGCSREAAPALRRIAILPIENLASTDGLTLDAGAMRVALWDALQGQGTVSAYLAGHRRDLPELRAAYVVDGYVTPQGFRLHWNDETLACAGTLEECAPKMVTEVALRAGVVPRPMPKAATLRAIAGGGTFAEAAKTDPAFSTVWLEWSTQAARAGGPAAALEILAKAPVATMAAFDAARVKARLTELQRDRKGHAKAMAELAAASPADVEVQEQAAREAASVRDFAAASAIYERLLAISRPAGLLNQAAYVAAFQGDRAKAESYATAAQAAAPTEAQFADTRGEIAYFFGDFGPASRHFEQAAELNPAFLNGLDLWKAADSARKAGEQARAEAILQRYVDARTKAGARNTLLLQGVWEWFGDRPEGAYEKLQTGMDSMERGKALFLRALMAMNRKEFALAERIRAELDGNSIESAFLRTIIDGVDPPPGLPVPAEALRALHRYLRGDVSGAKEAMAAAREKLDPLTEGQWRKLDALIAGRAVNTGVLPASPDDWLAVVLR